MSLDLLTLGNNGKPEQEVKLSMETHERLITLVQNKKLPIFSRLRDYYEDSEIEWEELPAFLIEVNELIGIDENEEGLDQLLIEIRELAEDAKNKRKSILALAD